ncbi:MAG TPA: nicotinate phosphoribosyltransferase [Methanomassiliicoccales archaeon]|mgnify:FL=1|nr:nicotinate phosphoribosyltransferase [Methanomassiliicoccales archaeon]HRR66470.1 nicotinate phosphoribosyltransferase [Methanomassiliicoccales archaeon]
MGRFFSAEHDDIQKGLTTDVYFQRTEAILKAKGLLDVHTRSEVTVADLPDAWPWAVLCGTEEVVRILEGREVDLYALPEGSLFTPRTRRGVKLPVASIDGPYGQYCSLETPALGFICYASGVATMAARCKLAAGNLPVISFGVRRMHPAMAPVIDRSSFIGGCDGVSSLKGAELVGKAASGTMPHSLVIMMGDQREAFKAFGEIIDPTVPRVALTDTFFDEKAEALMAAEAMPGLRSVRLDTPGSRRGNMADIVREVRWELDLRGYTNVGVFVSGGLDEIKIKELASAGANGFGVGTSISNAPTIDFAMDIVEKAGKPIAKRGKFAGRKYVFKCPDCLEYEVSLRRDDPPKCSCGEEMRWAEVKVIEKGKRLVPEEPAEEIRRRVLRQMGRAAL